MKETITECIINGVIYVYDGASILAHLDKAKKYYSDMVYMGVGEIFAVNGIRQTGSDKYHFFRFKTSKEIKQERKQANAAIAQLKSIFIAYDWINIMDGTYSNEWKIPTASDSDILQQFKNSNMKIKKQIEKLEGVELVQKADKDTLVVYLKEKLTNKKLRKEAAKRYPVGTKFIDMEDGKIRTVASNYFLVGDCEVNCDTPEEEWEDHKLCSNPFLFLNGKWAEIVTPLFKTEDGVDLYEGDLFYVVDKEKLVFKEWMQLAIGYKTPPTKRQFIATHETPNPEQTTLYFSSKSSAQAWIDAQKLTVLYENLTKEATERGLIDGANYLSPNGVFTRIVKYPLRLTSDKSGLMDSKCNFIFHDNKWATKIEDPKSLKLEELIDGYVYVDSTAGSCAPRIFRFSKVNMDGDGVFYSQINSKNRYSTPQRYNFCGSTLRIATIKEKKQLITAEVNNGYFYGL